MAQRRRAVLAAICALLAHCAPVARAFCAGGARVLRVPGVPAACDACVVRLGATAGWDTGRSPGVTGHFMKWRRPGAAPARRGSAPAVGASAGAGDAAGRTEGEDAVATAGGSGQAVAQRVRLLWELEDAVQTRDFEKAQALQGLLRQELALEEGELLPVGKDALAGKLVLVAGGNGRLGSQVVRELLRRGCSVRATVRSSDDVRDFERLSYEVGAEEGLGDIQAPWVRKTVEMSGTAQMASYGLGRLSVVDCNLMDPEAVAKALRDVDSVFWCASDFDGGSWAGGRGGEGRRGRGREGRGG